jgi:hypothetical protein
MDNLCFHCVLHLLVARVFPSFFVDLVLHMSPLGSVQYNLTVHTHPCFLELGHYAFCVCMQAIDLDLISLET